MWYGQLSNIDEVITGDKKMQKRRSRRIRRPVWGDKYENLDHFLSEFCRWTEQERVNALLYIDERRGLSFCVLRPSSKLRNMPYFLGIANKEGEFNFSN
ncbi:hypothetical protein LCGC14_2755200 [marine sediment metagenome]|uniref:Uncharacterized protein n=1 Tax=marine sediment metagenome TaxID=412755 RepID=A0A0F9B964_9ZZZZ